MARSGGVRIRNLARMADDPRSHYQRMLDGDLYIADDPRIVREQAEAHRLQEAYNRTPAADGHGRALLLDRLLGSVGTDVVVRAPLYVDFGTHTAVGDRTFVNYGLVALDVATDHHRGRLPARDRTSSCSPRSTRSTPTSDVTSGSRRHRSPSATTCGSAAG